MKILTVSLLSICLIVYFKLAPGGVDAYNRHLRWEQDETLL